MNSIEEIIAKIKQIEDSGKTILIAIDGFGGSGKSSVSKSIQKFFSNTTIVEMDDFYSPSLKRADFQRVLDQVVQPLRNNQTAIYQIYDWQKDILIEAKPILPGSNVIIEGVFSLTQELADNYDIKIWVECPPEVGLERGVTRDGEEVRDKWTNIWMPMEKEYVKTQNPKGRADYIIDGTKLSK